LLPKEIKSGVSSVRLSLRFATRPEKPIYPVSFGIPPLYTVMNTGGAKDKIFIDTVNMHVSKIRTIKRTISKM
jgi:hypothetical protein